MFPPTKCTSSILTEAIWARKLLELDPIVIVAFCGAEAPALLRTSLMSALPPLALTFTQ